MDVKIIYEASFNQFNREKIKIKFKKINIIDNGPSQFICIKLLKKNQIRKLLITAMIYHL